MPTSAADNAEFETVKDICNTVAVFVHLILPPATNQQLFEPGTWISVIGYTTSPSLAGLNMASATPRDDKTHLHGAFVTAILITPAPSPDPRQLQEGMRSRIEAALKARRAGGLALRDSLRTYAAD